MPSRRVRLRTSAGAVALALGLLVAAALPVAAAAAPFAQRYSENVRGDLRLAANTLLTCDGALPGCANSRAGIGASLNNNAYAGQMVFVDTDGDATTANSSQATLGLPAGATVRHAGLYWGGRVASATSDATFGQVRLRTPASGGYVAVTAASVDSVGTAASGARQGYADVTGLVRAGGAGSYTLGGVALSQRTNDATSNFGGWTLVVAYQDLGAPRRNLAVFDGLVSVGATQDIEVTGFQTPEHGPVNATMGVVGYEGDRTSTSDAASVNGVTLADALTPADNFFNSRITRLGADAGGRTPSHGNQLGYDSKLVAVPAGAIPNGATSARFTVNTSPSDTYFPGVIATAVALNDVQAVKTARNLTRPGLPAASGDLLEYAVRVTNGDGNGAPTAREVVVRDPVPAHTTFEPGSLRIVGNPQAGVEGAKTDAADGDQAELAGGAARLRIGAGATGASGGELLDGQSASVAFRVRVDAGVPSGTAIVNVATVDYTTTAGALSAQTNTVTSVAQPPVASIAVPAAGARFPRGDGPVAALGCSGVANPIECRAEVRRPDGSSVAVAAGDRLPDADAGTHLLTVAALDANGRRHAASRAYEVTAPPQATIARPAADAAAVLGSRVEAGFGCAHGEAPLRCVGEVRRPDGTSVEATSGGALPTDRPGRYVLAVTATDAADRVATATRAYRVAERPVPAVTGPPADTTFAPGQRSGGTFGCATDAPLVSCLASVRLPDGTSVDLRDGDPLPTAVPGAYELTVAATDALGQTTTALRRYVVAATGSAPPPALAPAAPLAPPRARTGAAQLVAGCARERLALTEVWRDARRVRVRGLAPAGAAGRAVAISSGAGRRLGAARVRPDGSFAATLPLPGSRGATHRLRLRAELGGARSAALKLTRRMTAGVPALRDGRIALTGRVRAPLARPGTEVVVRQRTRCDGPWHVAARVALGDGGAFAATLPRPAGADAVLLRLQTRVRGSRRNPKTFPTYTLLRSVELP